MANADPATDGFTDERTPQPIHLPTVHNLSTIMTTTEGRIAVGTAIVLHLVLALYTIYWRYRIVVRAT